MKDKEIEAFESRFGYKPTAIRVAIDALAVYVHKDSPLEALSIAQVDAAFSETRRCGAPVSVDSWGDFGLSGSWEERPIQLYGRNSVSGTYGYFKKVGLCSGDFKGSVNEQPGSASVVRRRLIFERNWLFRHRLHHLWRQGFVAIKRWRSSD